MRRTPNPNIFHGGLVKTIFSPFIASRAYVASGTSPLQLCEARPYLNSMLEPSLYHLCVRIHRCSPSALWMLSSQASHCLHSREGMLASGLGFYHAVCTSWGGSRLRSSSVLFRCNTAEHHQSEKSQVQNVQASITFWVNRTQSGKSESWLHAWNY